MALAITPLLSQLNRIGGSDLHLRAGSVPTVRVDGTLHRLEVPALDDEGTLALLLETMPERLKARYLDGGDVDYAFEPALGERLRVNAFHFRGRPAAVLRLVLAKPLRLQDLDLPAVLSDLALRPHGLTLVTGRAGSGKTTTLAAMAEEINVSKAAHVLTLEDPIEILVPEKMAVVTQREIVSDVETFGTALRSAMRQDPNVIVVGEMRDEETVRAALVAAETGHHVISTLHTTDATSSVHRILDLFPPQEQKQIRVTLAAVLNGVVCQRLVPRADGRGRVAATEMAVNTGPGRRGHRRPGEDRQHPRPGRRRRIPRDAHLPPGPGPAARRRGHHVGGRTRGRHGPARPRGRRSARRSVQPDNVGVTDEFDDDSQEAPVAVVKRLRGVRHTLEWAVRELRVWIDLLRHKAAALRAVTAASEASARSLTPGSLKPEALAEALAAGIPAPRSKNRPPLRVVGDDTDDLLRRARVLWETVADPDDPIATHDLANAADRLADRLEVRWREARDELRSTRDQLAHALARAHTDDTQAE